MSITPIKYETKPITYDVIFVDGDKLDDVARYLGASSYIVSRSLSRNSPDEVSFFIEGNSRIFASVGEYLARCNDVDSENSILKEWISLSAEELNERFKAVNTPYDFGIHPPYDR